MAEKVKSIHMIFLVIDILINSKYFNWMAFGCTNSTKSTSKWEIG